MKKYRCKSGLTGWCGNVRNQYANFDEFAGYAETYGLPTRLGFDFAEAAWEANPIVEGSVNPTDYRLHREPYRLVLPSGSSARGAQMGHSQCGFSQEPVLSRDGGAVATPLSSVAIHFQRSRWICPQNRRRPPARRT